MNIPTFEEADFAEHIGATTPLTHFIYHNEPAGREAEMLFREQLSALIEWVQNQTANLEVSGRGDAKLEETKDRNPRSA